MRQFPGFQTKFEKGDASLTTEQKDGTQMNENDK
jgi:hypothetical protein